MRILIAYASTDGQTRKIARFCADRLTDAGHSVELLQAGDAEGLDPSRFDAAILAGSVHTGHYQKALAQFASGQGGGLSGLHTLFLSVSLAAAGDDKEDWAGLERIVDDFFTTAGWRPTRIAHVAGAFRFTEYDFFRAWAMRWIAAQKGEEVDPHEDREYTDWEALAQLLGDWTAAFKDG